MKDKRVLVEVAGGVATVTANPHNIGVVLIDWDNVKAGDTPDFIPRKGSRSAIDRVIRDAHRVARQARTDPFRRQNYM